MAKGLFILLIVFIVVSILHFTALRMMKVSEKKKAHFRKFYWYLYGTFFVLSGALNLFEKGQFDWIYSIQSLIGLLFVVMNFLGKLEPKVK